MISASNFIVGFVSLLAAVVILGTIYGNYVFIRYSMDEIKEFEGGRNMAAAIAYIVDVVAIFILVCVAIFVSVSLIGWFVTVVLP